MTVPVPVFATNCDRYTEKSLIFPTVPSHDGRRNLVGHLVLTEPRDLPQLRVRVRIHDQMLRLARRHLRQEQRRLRRVYHVLCDRRSCRADRRIRREAGSRFSRSVSILSARAIIAGCMYSFSRSGTARTLVTSGTWNVASA